MGYVNGRDILRYPTSNNFVVERLWATVTTDVSTFTTFKSCNSKRLLTRLRTVWGFIPLCENEEGLWATGRLVLFFIRPYCWKLVYEVIYPDYSASCKCLIIGTTKRLNEIRDVESWVMIGSYQAAYRTESRRSLILFFSSRNERRAWDGNTLMRSKILVSPSVSEYT